MFDTVIPDCCNYYDLIYLKTIPVISCNTKCTAFSQDNIPRISISFFTLLPIMDFSLRLSVKPPIITISGFSMISLVFYFCITVSSVLLRLCTPYPRMQYRNSRFPLPGSGAKSLYNPFPQSASAPFRRLHPVSFHP